jgi:hypothetical protein
LKRLNSSGLNSLDDGNHIGSELDLGALVPGHHGGNGLLWIWGSELNPLRLGRRQTQSRPFRNQLPLTLGDQGENTDRELVSVWAIAADEIHSTVLEPEKELGVSGQPIKFCDDECGLGPLAPIQSRCQLGSSLGGFLACFDFGELLVENTLLAINKPANDFTLRAHAVAVQPLLSCGNSKITDVSFFHADLDTSGQGRVNSDFTET